MRRRFLIASLSVCAALLVLDWIFYLKFDREFGALGVSKSVLARGRYQPSPFMVYEPIRGTVNLRAKWRQNNYGFRNEEDVLPKQEGEFRIFLLGGSTAIGLGSMKEFERITGVGEYPTALTITERLREKLEALYPTQKFTVFNAAVSGHRVSHEFSLYMSTVRWLDPDMIVLLDGYNEIAVLTSGVSRYAYDFDRDSSPQETRLRSVGAFLMGRSFLCFYLGRAAWMGANRYDGDFRRTWLERIPVVDGEAMTASYLEKKPVIDVQIADLLKRYEIFKAACEIDGVEILFCLQPLLPPKPQKDETETACYNFLMSMVSDPLARACYFDVYARFREAFRSWAEGAHADYIDLQEDVNARSEGIFIDYCHFSPDGNDFVASVIAAKLEEMGILRP